MTGGGPAGASEIWITQIYQHRVRPHPVRPRLGLLGHSVHRDDGAGLLLRAGADPRATKRQRMSTIDDVDRAPRRARAWRSTAGAVAGDGSSSSCCCSSRCCRWPGCCSRRSSRSSPRCSIRPSGCREPDAARSTRRCCRPASDTGRDFLRYMANSSGRLARDDRARRRRRRAGRLRLLALPVSRAEPPVLSVLLRNMFPAVVFLMPLFIMMRGWAW